MRSGSRVMLSCSAGGFGRFLLLVLGSLLGPGSSNAALALVMSPARTLRPTKGNEGSRRTGSEMGLQSKSRPRLPQSATIRPSRRCKNIGKKGPIAAAAVGLAAAAASGLAVAIGKNSSVLAVGTTPTGLGQAPADASRWSEGGADEQLLAHEQSSCTAFPEDGSRDSYTINPCVISVPLGADVRSACGKINRQEKAAGEKIEAALRVCHAKAFIDPNHGKATLEPDNSCAGSSPSTPLEIAEIGFFKDAAAASAQQAKFEKLPGYIPEKNEVHIKLTKEEVRSLSRRMGLWVGNRKPLFEAEANTIRNIFRRAGVKLANAKEDVEGEARVYRVRAVDEILGDYFNAPPPGSLYPPVALVHGYKVCPTFPPPLGNDYCADDTLVAVVSLEAPALSCGSIPHATLSGPLVRFGEDDEREAGASFKRQYQELVRVSHKFHEWKTKPAWTKPAAWNEDEEAGLDEAASQLTLDQSLFGKRGTKQDGKKEPSSKGANSIVPESGKEECADFFKLMDETNLKPCPPETLCIFPPQAVGVRQHYHTAPDGRGPRKGLLIFAHEESKVKQVCDG